jgi:hypothetical protein
VWSSIEGPRALFDRAVVHLIGNRVLLPGISTLAQMVAEAAGGERAAAHRAVRGGPARGAHRLLRLLEVPGRGRASDLEQLRQRPVRISGKAMEHALRRTAEVRSVGVGAVDVAQVPAARMAGWPGTV